MKCFWSIDTEDIPAVEEVLMSKSVFVAKHFLWRMFEETVLINTTDVQKNYEQILGCPVTIPKLTVF